MSKSTPMTGAHTGPARSGVRLAALAARLGTLRRRLQRYRTRFGQQGTAAVLLASIGAGIYLLSIEPSLALIDQARQRLALPQRKAPAAAAPAPQAVLEQLQTTLADERQFPDRLDQLVQYAGEAGLLLNDGAYAVAREAHGQVVRYEVTLPVHGSYPQVRRFVAAVLAREKAVALVDLQFRRAKISDPALEAVIKLAYFMRASP